MRQLAAFAAKDLMELVRSGKLAILAVLFVLFGIMNPAIAKLIPWIMEMAAESLEESGLTVTGTTVDAMTSWTQFFKNMPIALLVLFFLCSGSVTAEWQKGTLIPVLARGMKRWKIIAAQATLALLLWSAGCWLSFGITYAYNAYFWDNQVVSQLGFAVFCFYLAGIWLLAQIPLWSVLFSSAAAVILGAGGSLAVIYLLGLLPRIRDWLPSRLLESSALLTAWSEPAQYQKAIAVTVLWIVFMMAAAVLIFNKKEIK